MSKKTGYLFGILLTIIIGILLNWWLCCGVQADGPASIEEGQVNQNKAAQTASNEAFVLNDPEADFLFSSDENFDFYRSDFSILEPIASQVDKGVDKLNTYLSADGNTGKYVQITGYYQGDEVNNSEFPNLGLARANSVKEYFKSKGISSGQINTFGTLKETLVPDGNIYRGPLKFLMGSKDPDLKTIEEPSGGLDEILEHIKADPLVLYFETAQASLILTPAQSQKITDIRYYLENVDGATVLVVGHADNTGSRSKNIELGQNRAMIAKKYLVSNSIPENKILITSDGPDNPIASNATEEGRAKNRRTVVTLN